MNIEFKESLFRFIFPASLFWSPILIFQLTIFQLKEITNLLNHTEVLLIVFLASGIIINAFGNFVIFVDNFRQKDQKNHWSKPDTEIGFWRNLAEEKKFVIDKVNGRWNYFVANLNSTIALFFSLIFIVCLYRLYSTVILLLILIIIIFFLLTKNGYKSVTGFDEKIRKLHRRKISL